MRIDYAQRLLLLLSAVLLGVMLSSCSGFQPRTENSVTALPLLSKQVNIAANQLDPDFQPILTRVLQDNGAQLVSEVTPGVIVLNVTGVDEDKTVSAYSAVRQVREFNHYIDLDFTARKEAAKHSKTVPTASKVRAERTQIYDSRYVLGVAEEERNIRNELRAEAVRLLALKLSVL